MWKSVRPGATHGEGGSLAPLVPATTRQLLPAAAVFLSFLLSSSAVWTQQKRLVVALAHLSCTRKLRSFAFAPLSNSVLLLLIFCFFSCPFKVLKRPASLILLLWLCNKPSSSIFGDSQRRGVSEWVQRRDQLDLLVFFFFPLVIISVVVFIRLVFS